MAKEAMLVEHRRLSLGELYSATSNEPLLGVNDPLIQRSFSEGKQLRTQQHDSNWLRSKSSVALRLNGPMDMPCRVD